MGEKSPPVRTRPLIRHFGRSDGSQQSWPKKFFRPSDRGATYGGDIYGGVVFKTAWHNWRIHEIIEIMVKFSILRRKCTSPPSKKKSAFFDTGGHFELVLIWRSKNRPIWWGVNIINKTSSKSGKATMARLANVPAHQTSLHSTTSSTLGAYETNYMLQHNKKQT